MEGMHVHLGFLSLLMIFIGLLPLFFFWRVIAIKLSQTPVGQAMAFII